jgi:hypothetical protein
MTLFKQLVRNEKRVLMLEEVHVKEMKLLDERSTGTDSEAAQGVAALMASKKKAKM